MLKPKNISIKKITQAQSQINRSRNRNSRKSLKIPKKDEVQSNKPSPVHIIKLDQSEDGSPDHGNFIACINGYLNKLDSCKDSRGRSVQDHDIDAVKRKIQKQKSINRNMQKNIMQFQRILWERTEKLQKLQQFMREIKYKQNNRSISNMNSHVKSRQKLHKPNIKQVSSEFQNIQSDYTQSQGPEQSFNVYNRRRKTQMPNEIQKMISRTMAMMPQKNNRKRV